MFDEVRPLLISEAVRGEGGRLINSKGEYFMEKLHPLKDLAPRNVVSEAIFNQMDKGNKVFLDLSHIDSEYVKKRFPNIYGKMKEYGYDITKENIPVTPIQHYFMGGIKVDLNGRTGIKALYSCGEASNTGVHGANRLASNSLLEAIVYGRRVAYHISSNIQRLNDSESGSKEDFINGQPGNNISDDIALEMINDIKSIMTGSASIIRDTERIKKALHNMSEIIESLEKYHNINTILGCEAFNMATCGKLILEAAYRRTDTLGTHILRS